MRLKILFIAISLFLLLSCSGGKLVIQSETDAHINAYPIENVNYKEQNINISYPSVSGMQDTEKQKKINDLLKSMAFQELADFSGNEKYNTEGISISLDNNISYQSDNYLSVNFTGDVILKEAAYPRSIFTTMNIDLNSGNRVRLSDVISIDNNFVNMVRKTLNSYIDKNSVWAIVYNDFLEHDDNYLLDLFREADSEFDDDCYSYFTNDGLGLSFATSHTAGDHFEIELKYEDIKEHITKNFFRDK
ncbi:polysaccharide deacetylase family protein [Lacrimispora brassicae]